MKLPSKERARWQASEQFDVVEIPQERSSSMHAAWQRMLPPSANGEASAAHHTVQSTAKDGGHGVFAEPAIVDDEAYFTFTLLRGNGTHARVGVAAADGSGQTWSIRLFDGALVVDPKPKPKPNPLKWILINDVSQIQRFDPRMSLASKEAQGLAKALESRTEFTSKEWEAFGIPSLSCDNFIVSRGAAGLRYFQPALSDADPKPLEMLKSGSEGGGRPLLTTSITARVNMGMRVVAFCVDDGMPIEPEGELPECGVRPWAQLFYKGDAVAISEFRRTQKGNFRMPSPRSLRPGTPGRASSPRGFRGGSHTASSLNRSRSSMSDSFSSSMRQRQPKSPGGGAQSARAQEMDTIESLRREAAAERALLQKLREQVAAEQSKLEEAHKRRERAEAAAAEAEAKVASVS